MFSWLELHSPFRVRPGAYLQYTLQITDLDLVMLEAFRGSRVGTSNQLRETVPRIEWPLAWGVYAPVRVVA